MIYVQFIYICDICARAKFERHVHFIGASPISPGTRPFDEDWQVVNGRHVCSNHTIKIDTTVDGKELA
jgi:hypothetical protein